MGSQVPELVTLGTNRPLTRLCDTRTVAVEREKPAPKGLEGVVATTTAISSVSDNFLQYRGYRIEELVGKAEYEEVAYLLLNGELPNKDQLRDFKTELTKHRACLPFLRGNPAGDVREPGRRDGRPSHGRVGLVGRGPG